MKKIWFYMNQPATIFGRWGGRVLFWGALIAAIRSWVVDGNFWWLVVLLGSWVYMKFMIYMRAEHEIPITEEDRLRLRAKNSGTCPCCGQVVES